MSLLLSQQALASYSGLRRERPAVASSPAVVSRTATATATGGGERERERGRVLPFSRSRSTPPNPRQIPSPSLAMHRMVWPPISSLCRFTIHPPLPTSNLGVRAVGIKRGNKALSLRHDGVVALLPLFLFPDPRVPILSVILVAHCPAHLARCSLLRRWQPCAQHGHDHGKRTGRGGAGTGESNHVCFGVSQPHRWK